MSPPDLPSLSAVLPYRASVNSPSPQEQTLALKGQISISVEDWSIEINLVLHEGSAHLEKTLLAMDGQTVQVFLVG